MFCPKCGNQVPDGSAFCPRCGNPLRPVAQPAARPVQGQQATPPMPGQPVVQPTTRSRGKAKVIIPIAAAVAAVAAVVVIGLATSWFGLAGTKATTSTGASVSRSVKSVNDYTWDELSAISKEMSASGSEDAALQVAEKYNLCTSDGKLDGTQVKSVTLSDGTQAEVQIAGFYHDDKSDGSGKAGITFIFKDAVAEHEMNPSDDSTGGWQSSEMRSWLSSDFMSTLPADLAKDIVTVDKLTNNVGQTTDISSVTVTQDAVWLFSPTELCGSISWYASSGDDAAYDAVLNAEGTEYQLFSDSGVSSNGSNAILMKNYLSADYAAGVQGGSCSWWARSAIPYYSHIFNDVSSDGNPSTTDFATFANGVVPGFCI